MEERRVWLEILERFVNRLFFLIGRKRRETRALDFSEGGDLNAGLQLSGSLLPVYNQDQRALHSNNKYNVSKDHE